MGRIYSNLSEEELTKIRQLYFQGLKVSAIAIFLKRSPNTVKNRLRQMFGNGYFLKNSFSLGNCWQCGQKITDKKWEKSHYCSLKCFAKIIFKEKTQYEL